MKTPLSDY